jgi:hypothetical protein
MDQAESGNVGITELGGSKVVSVLIAVVFRMPFDPCEPNISPGSMVKGIDGSF